MAGLCALGPMRGCSRGPCTRGFPPWRRTSCRTFPPTQVLTGSRRARVRTARRGGPMKDPVRFHVGYAIAAVIGVLLLQYLIGTAREIATIPYSQFEQLLKDGKVAEIGISNRFIQGRLKEAV